MKQFKIYLINHSHIDVGYTERQEKMTVYQADFMRQAVDFALSDRQEARDSRSKFKFTAEGFWAVEQYLKRYGEQGKERLIAAGFPFPGPWCHFGGKAPGEKEFWSGTAWPITVRTYSD